MTRVLIDGTRATGVQYRYRGRPAVAHADGEVILCAGAIGSPKVLMLSGIGPEDHLRSLGLAVTADLPGVGCNLQDHPFSTFTYSVSVSTLNVEATFLGFVKHGVAFLLRGRGGATACGATALVFGKTSEEHLQPDFELTFRPFAVGRQEGNDAGRAPGSVLKPMAMAAVQSGAWLCHPRSRGAVSLRSANPHDPPVIRHAVLGERSDVAGLTAACRRVREVFCEDALRPYLIAELQPGPQVVSDDEWATYLRAHIQRGGHAVGTCRMGTGRSAVVDPDLRVVGVEGLRVVDASVIPELISGHTNAPTIMIAERAADLIRGHGLAYQLPR